MSEQEIQMGAFDEKFQAIDGPIAGAMILFVGGTPTYTHIDHNGNRHMYRSHSLTLSGAEANIAYIVESEWDSLTPLQAYKAVCFCQDIPYCEHDLTIRNSRDLVEFISRKHRYPIAVFREGEKVSVAGLCAITYDRKYVDSYGKAWDDCNVIDKDWV